MTYQQIVDMCRTSANAVNPLGFFHHGRREDFSLEYYQDSFRQGHAGIGLIAPTPRTTINRTEGIVTHECVLVFMKQDSMDSDVLVREQIISDMDVLSNLFMDYIFNNYNIIITNEVKTPDYRQFMGTLSGYSMTFTIQSYLPCANESQS